MLNKSQIRKHLDKLPLRSSSRNELLEEVERNAIARFMGQMPELVAALGVLRVGDHLGWRPLVIIHNKRTIRKYEEILGIEIRHFFPEIGPSAERSRGYAIAMAIGNFWKAVSGEIKVEGRQELT
jgi:hypothetical protein